MDPSSYVYATAYRFIDATGDYQNGDEATAVTWSSLASGSNEVQTIELSGIEKFKSGAFEFVASGAALAAGVAALL